MAHRRGAVPGRRNWIPIAGAALALVAGFAFALRPPARAGGADEAGSALRLRAEVESLRSALERARREERESIAGPPPAESPAPVLQGTERERFASLLEEYRASVHLIHVEVAFPDIVDPDTGAPLSLEGYGTGWIASDDGLLVTNKHVVELWKFEATWQAFLASRPGTRVVTAIHAWPSATAPDDWVETETELGGVAVRTRVHAHTDDDLAALRLTGGPFRAIPVEPRPDSLRPLDPVLLLGFPLGGQVLEGGRADVSASMGTVRFVGRTVAHTASAFPGNSGGPLLSIEGKVVGVLTRAPITPDGKAAETFSSAIRSDAVLHFLEGLR